MTFSVGKNIIKALLMCFIFFLFPSVKTPSALFRCSFLSSLKRRLFSKWFRMRWRRIWYTMMANNDTTCHKNHMSICLMYAVLGRSPLMALNKVTITNSDVPAPMNLLLKSCSVGSMKRVEYPKNHKINVGKNELISWLVNSLVISMLMMNFVDSFVLFTLLRIFSIENWSTIQVPLYVTLLGLTNVFDYSSVGACS